MNKNIQVSAEFKNGFGMELVKIHLKNDSGEVSINNEQWREIKDTIEGKRKSVASQEMDGYLPKEFFVWN